MPSFGLLKEQVLTSLEEKYTTDKQLFQEELNKLVKTLKKSEVLSELFRQYDIVLKTHFDDAEYAKEYLQETIEYMRTLKISSSDNQLLEALNRKNISEDKISPYITALDTLVFGNKKNIKERLEAKQLLIHKLITENKDVIGQINPQLKSVFFEILQKKVKTRLDGLNEQEIAALNAYAEKDQDKLLKNYIRLIDDNISAIDEQFTEHGGSQDHFVKLKQVKETLVEMKNEKPTLTNLDRLLFLKEGFVR